MIWQAMSWQRIVGSWQFEDSWQLAKGNSWQKEEIFGKWQCEDNCLFAYCQLKSIEIIILHSE